MRSTAAIIALLASVVSAAAVRAQGPGPGWMHDWGTGWGWGGMWLGPLFVIVPLALLVALVVVLVRWLGGGSDDSGRRVRTARDILDERYARGEIDREEYQRRRNDIAGA